MFQEGGWAMYAVLAIGVPAWFFTLIAGGVLIFKRRPLQLVLGGLLPTVCGLLAIQFGAIGYYNGMSMADEAIAFADPSMQDAMLAEAGRMAMYPVYFGLALGTIPTLVGALCFVLALSIRRSEA